MRTKIVEAVLKDAPAWMVGQGRALAKEPGNIAELLLRAGFTPRDVLEACAQVTGLPPAPQAWLRDPRPPSVDDLDVSLLRRLGAAPLASVAGRLCIGFLDPEVAAASDKLGLPAHTAYLALPSDLAKALAALPAGADEGAPTRLQPQRAYDGGIAEAATIGMQLQGRNPIGNGPLAGRGIAPPTPAAFGMEPGLAESDEVMTISADLSDLARAASVMVGGPGSDPGAGFENAATSLADPRAPAAAQGAGADVDDDADARTSLVPSFAAQAAVRDAQAALAAQQHASEAEVVTRPGVLAAPQHVAPAHAHGAQHAVHTAPGRAPSTAGPTEEDDLAELQADDFADVLADAPTLQPMPAPRPAVAQAQTIEPVTSPTVKRPAAHAAHTLDDLDEPRTELVPLVMSEALVAATRPKVPEEAATISDPGISRSEIQRRIAEAQRAVGADDEDDELAATERDPAAVARARAALASPDASTRMSARLGASSLPDAARTSPDGASRGASTFSGPPTAPRPSPTFGRAAASPPPAVTAPHEPASLDDGSQVEILIPDAPDATDDDLAAPARTQAGAFEAKPEGKQVDIPALAGASGHERERLKRVAQLAAIRRYRLERVLGRGGMAAVYAATDTQTGKPCALKVMEPSLSDDEAFVERFRREVRQSRALVHENIVRTYDSGEEDRTYYMVSELIDGGTVQALARAVPHGLPVALVLPMMKGLLAGLQAAHDAGIIHRDLKPANLMLTSQGVLKICDFGIGKQVGDATLTKTGALFGTPAYMSPEQAQGFGLDARSDVYGAGIVLYELLAGANPFVADSPGATMMNIARGYHADVRDAVPGIPAALGAVIERMLARDVDERYASASAALADIASLAPLVERRATGGVARAIKDPVGVSAELARAEAQLHAAHGAFALEKTPPEPAEAAFRYYCAAQLDPKNADAADALAELKAEYAFRFTRPEAAEAAELEVRLREEQDPAIARRLLELAGRERALLETVRWARAALALGPNDPALRQRIDRITGPDPLAPFSAPSQPASRPPVTADGVTAPSPPAPGLSTVPQAPAPGGAAFDAVAAAALEDSTSAWAGREEAAGEDGAVAAPALTPSGGVARSQGRRKIKERVRKQEAPPPEPPKPEPPRPNLRELAMLDPALPPPPESSLPKKKPTLSDVPANKRTGEINAGALADAQAAKKGKSGGGAIAAVLAVVVILGGIAAWRFTSPAVPELPPGTPPPSSRPPPQKLPPPQQQQPAAKQGPAKQAPVQPIAPPEKPRSGDQSIAQRQAELLKKGKDEPDALKAVRLLTQALEIDPLSVAAKEALLLRAQRYETAGDLRRAAFDYKSVLRQNVEQSIKEEAQKGLARVEAAPK